MTTRTDYRPGLAVAGLAAILALVTGCAVVNDVVYGKVDTTSANAESFERDHPGLAPWLPDDARDIRLVSSTRAEGTHTMLLTSASDSADGCRQVDRRSGPPIDMGDDLDVYRMETVLVCEGWAIARGDDQWLAWTPAVEAGS